MNVAAYVGHGTVREQVMGDDFKRTGDAEPRSRRCRPWLAEEMAAGALGLSSGLEYDPGIYSARDEVLALAKTAGAAHGRYISHIRSEDRAFWDAIDEIIKSAASTNAGAVSHMKLAMTSIWGQATV